MTSPCIEHYLAERKAMVDAALAERLAVPEGEGAKLHEAMRHAVLGGGKRVRPLLSLAVGELDPRGPQAVLDAACAIEMAHAASLVLDDLPCMDDAENRRNQPCVHVVFGIDTAILAGIALISRAYGLVALNATALDPSAAPTAVGVMSEALGDGGLAMGQHLDLALTEAPPPLAQVERIHRLKAGALFEAAVRLPAVLLGLPEGEVRQLEAFARATGLAFQIADDVIDAREDADGAEHCSFVSSAGAPASRERLAALTRDAADALTPLGERAARLRELAVYVGERNV